MQYLPPLFSAAKQLNAHFLTSFKLSLMACLKVRKTRFFGINEIGFLNVQIRDLESNRVFDLDGMSSGEKGLILTFLMIARSVVQHGIVLLDEPELLSKPSRL